MSRVRLTIVLVLAALGAARGNKLCAETPDPAPVAADPFPVAVSLTVPPAATPVAPAPVTSFAPAPPILNYAPSIPSPRTYAAPAVVASPFRAGDFHPGHNCPACGASQYVISGHNRDGSHNHACPRCGTVWRHRRRVFVRRLKVR